MCTAATAKRARRKARMDPRYRPASGTRYTKQNARAKANTGKMIKKPA